jgi:hypothetical protein
VLYQGQENDPIIDALASAVTSDSPSEVIATYEAFLPYFEEYYETYGREIELIVYQGTGTAIDEVAARADAVKIAEEIQPFAVWEGPILTPAFSEELAARGILNIGLGGGAKQPGPKKVGTAPTPRSVSQVSGQSMSSPSASATSKGITPSGRVISPPHSVCTT